MNASLAKPISSELLNSIIQEQAQAFAQQKLGIEREVLSQLEMAVKSSQILVISGLRRVGKSTLLAQIAHKYLAPDEFYYINFEDERLLNFTVAEFDLLYESLMSLFGKRSIFLFDEIQNVPQWERFVRRLHDQRYKFILTGSNASLLSQELGTRLTGRYLSLELYPFSFHEFISFKQAQVPDLNQRKGLTTTEKAKFLRLMNQYVKKGGIPDALKYADLDIHKTLYEDVLYRDIASRYGLENVQALKELALYLMSNTANLISFNKLKELLKIGSTNTIKNYVTYLENSWLFFVVNKFASSVKEQQIAPKKIFGIDLGLIQSVGFSFSDNIGRLMENLVFLQLKRQFHQDIYYYKTADNHEVDFYLPKAGLMIQVCHNFDQSSTQEREVRSLLEAKQERNSIKQLLILTQKETAKIETKQGLIQVRPLYEWLLES